MFSIYVDNYENKEIAKVVTDCPFKGLVSIVKTFSSKYQGKAKKRAEKFITELNR